jgi:hypothetical protein
VYYREPSYGTFSTNMNVEYFFGQPRNVHFSGVLMDMDRMKSSAEAKNNCWEKWVNFNKTSGRAMSAYEHLVPGKLFSTATEKAEGVSAVKALALANQQGQRTYTINQQNYQTALPQLTISNATKNEIRTAVEEGKIATVHQAPITHHGWTGEGYIILDPETGAGAYKLSGGADGGAVGLAIGHAVALMTLLALASLFAGAVVAQIFTPLFAVSLALIGAGFALLATAGAIHDEDIREVIVDAALGLIIAGIVTALGLSAAGQFMVGTVLGMVSAYVSNVILD